MYQLKSLSQKGMLIELIHLLNQAESKRIALYGSLAAANNIYFEADFVQFIFSVSAKLPIDRLAAQTPVFPEWNASVLCPFFCRLQFNGFSIIGGGFEFELMRPTSGDFVSKLFITDLIQVIQTIFDESDNNDGAVITSSSYTANNLDLNFKTYHLAIGAKNNPINNGTVYSYQGNFQLDRYFDGWYEFSAEDGGDSNFLDWAFKVRALPIVYLPKLIPEAIAETMARLEIDGDPTQVASLQVDLPNLKANIEIVIRFNEDYGYPLKITA